MTSTETIPTKEEIEEFINELMITDMTEFIDNLIQNMILTRDMIYFDSKSNNTVKYWYLATHWDDYLTDILNECDISYAELGERVFIGINCEYEDLVKQPKWIQLCIIS